MIQIYTGDGKGKTTAALGLALRAIGAQKKVAIVQFLKKSDTAEYKAIKKFKLPILIETFGIGFFKILGDNKPIKAHRQAAANALAKAETLILSKKYDLIILDEINITVDLGLINLNEVVNILTNKPKKLEIILTGRNAHPKLKKMADLVTVMKKGKHYFDQNIKARKGIEY